MIQNSIRSRTVTFLAAQSVILGVIMLAFVILTSVLFVKNALRWQLNKIEQSVLIFAQQAAHSGEVPKRGDLGEYSFFILNQEGKYILPRLPRSDEGEKLWQEHESKLIYEMQKRRDGWIYYPEREHLGLSGGQYVIRYVYIEKQGWIISAEGYLPGAWSLLKGFLTPKLFLGLFLIICLAFAFMLLNAFWHFRKMMKAILRFQENNFIVAPVSAKTSPEPNFIKPEDKSLAAGIIRNMPEQVLPKVRAERPAGSEERNHETGRSEALTDTATTRQGPEHKELPELNPRQLDPLGAMTIDTEEIRSPLLKKVIQDMRDMKK